MKLLDKKLVLHIRKNDLPSSADLAFILFFSGIALRSILLRAIGFVGLSSIGPVVSSAFHVFTCIVLITAFFKAGQEKRTDSIILFLLIIVAFVFSYLLNPEIGVWLADEEYGVLNSVVGLEGGVFSGGIIGYVVVRVQKSADRIFYNLKICNVIWILYLIWLTINRLHLGYFEVANVNGQIVQLSYHMSYGYYCTFISILNFSLFKKEKKIPYLIIGLLFGLLSISFGARGVVIVYAIYIISLIWISLIETSMAKKVLISVFVATIALFCVNYYTEILFGVQHLLQSLGVADSRTLTSMLSGEITETNGREQIWSMATEMIKDRFPFGYGVYGERPVVGARYGWGYCHNIFLEIIIAFGIIGLIIDALLIIKSVLIINNTTNRDWNLLFVIFISNCGMLLISSSFWYSSYFWATVAIGVSYMKDIRLRSKASIIGMNTSFTNRSHE